jgi:hypothetical protein
MKTNRAYLLIVCVAALITIVPSAQAQRQLGKKKGPTSKIYIAESNGDSQILLDGKVHAARQATAFDAPGTIIETKEGANNTIVYSNGTGMFIDQNTRVEVNEFRQETFKARKAGSTDTVTEPSISRSDVFMSRGAVGICTPQLVAGSSMNYGTPEAGVNIRGGKVSIESNDNVTTIDLLEGDITVRGGGGKDGGGQIIHPGERAVIRPGLVGRPPQITISQIPPDQLQAADDRVSVACNAKKTVTFEVIEQKAAKGLEELEVAKVATSEAKPDGSATFSDTEIAGADPVAAGASNDGATTEGDTIQVIVIKPTVPLQLPINLVVSPDRLPGG